jgi:bifunctional lysine-specific demethylase and histidyl-hydroxylase MINA
MQRMLFEEARQIWAQFLAPVTLDEFLDQTLSAGFRSFPRNTARAQLLGADPQALLGAAYQLAAKLTFHSANPTGAPPSLLGIEDAAAFRHRIEEFHARNYSVRFPELRPLSAPLEQLARALEVLLHQPVTTSAFWSRGGMRAPVHFDDHDLLVVQLRGAKRWYVTERPSELPNVWQGIPAADAHDLGPHAVIDLQPGDMLYLPRGTLHTVDSDTASLHLAIGFTPLSVRELVLAALDHLSDLEPRLRGTAGARLAFQLQGAGLERLAPKVLEAVEQLRGACRTPGFLAAALQRRSARAVGGLATLARPAAPAPLGLDSVLVQAENAFCHLTANAEKIDFSYPGGHIYLHRGVEQSLTYMVNTPRFRVRDIPGTLADEVRLSLAARLVEVGYLRPE